MCAEHPPYQVNFCQITKAQKEGKSDGELDEMWWKQAGELVANYYKQREEVEKDVEGVEQNSCTGEIFGYFCGMFAEKRKIKGQWEGCAGTFLIISATLNLIPGFTRFLSFTSQWSYIIINHILLYNLFQLNAGEFCWVSCLTSGGAIFNEQVDADR